MRVDYNKFCVKTKCYFCDYKKMCCVIRIVEDKYWAHWVDICEECYKKEGF